MLMQARDIPSMEKDILSCIQAKITMQKVLHLGMAQDFTEEERQVAKDIICIG